jgi:hypothetical protein
MPLYISQLSGRLNFGSVSLRLPRHGSGSFLMNSVKPPFSTFCPLPNQYGPRKCPHEVIDDKLLKLRVENTKSVH